MARVNGQGYVEMKRNKGVWRNWWLIKTHVIKFSLRLPERYVGKRIRLKVEVIDDDKNN